MSAPMYPDEIPGFFIVDSQELAPIVEEHIPAEYREDIQAAIVQELDGLVWFTESNPWSRWSLYYPPTFWQYVDPEDLYGCEHDPRNRDTLEV